MNNQKKQYIFITCITVFTFFGIFLGCILGPSAISFKELFYVLIGSGESNHALIIYEVRLPRILCAYIVGFALGISGAALQGLLRNPLAEPGVLGVSSSATLTATFVLSYGISANNAFILPVIPFNCSNILNIGLRIFIKLFMMYDNMFDAMFFIFFNAPKTDDITFPYLPNDFSVALIDSLYISDASSATSLVIFE